MQLIAALRAACLLVLLSTVSSAAAQEPRLPLEEAPGSAPADAPIFGVWPDLALTVGAGIGIGGALDSNVFARLRAGGLFAFEPWVLNFGVTAEAGALAELGYGVELELNHMSGPFLQVNASRVEHDRFMGHLALGYFIFGVEWQHAFGDDSGDALLFMLRLPAGLLWFMPHHAGRSEPGG